MSDLIISALIALAYVCAYTGFWLKAMEIAEIPRRKSIIPVTRVDIRA